MPSPLASLVFWAAVLCCVVAEAAIVRSTAVARAAAASGDGDLAMPRVRKGAELTWAVLPALALAGVLAWTWREMHRAPDAAPPAAAAPVVP